MTDKPIIIIKCEAPDFDKLAQLRHKLWPQETVEEHLSEITDLTTNHDYHAWLAFDEADKTQPIAFMELSLRPYVNGCLYRPVAFLEGIYCHPEYQQQGIGGQLVEIAEDWARDKDIQELASDAYLENEQSHKAHARWGFSQTEKVVYFRKKL